LGPDYTNKSCVTLLRLGQPLHRYLTLQPLDLILRDSRHLPCLRLKPCQVLFGFLNTL
jgi:hypothetical protein